VIRVVWDVTPCSLAEARRYFIQPTASIQHELKDVLSYENVWGSEGVAPSTSDIVARRGRVINFTPRPLYPPKYQILVWVPRADVDNVVDRYISCSCRELNSDPSIVMAFIHGFGVCLPCWTNVHCVRSEGPTDLL